jgi:hypothetical protein
MNGRRRILAALSESGGSMDLAEYQDMLRDDRSLSNPSTRLRRAAHIAITVSLTDAGRAALEFTPPPARRPARRPPRVEYVEQPCQFMTPPTDAEIAQIEVEAQSAAGITLQNYMHALSK